MAQSSKAMRTRMLPNSKHRATGTRAVRDAVPGGPPNRRRTGKATGPALAAAMSTFPSGPNATAARRRNLVVVVVAGEDAEEGAAVAAENLSRPLLKALKVRIHALLIYPVSFIFIFFFFPPGAPALLAAPQGPKVTDPCADHLPYVLCFYLFVVLYIMNVRGYFNYFPGLPALME